ncbi:MAG: phosphohydrolase [Armatimonadetes bacterium]|nr:phosphohydrolase [Armatimonadota bacterium]MDW8122425.1 phosphohydrolase [Armatimonadota bacterium]
MREPGREQGIEGHFPFGPDDPVCLFLGDVDSIKSFVYETNSLPEIRGASTLLTDVEECLRQLLKEHYLLYCAGGGFLAIVKADQAESLKDQIENLYQTKTHLATITVVLSEPVRYKDLNHGPIVGEEGLSEGPKQGVAQDLLISHLPSPPAKPVKGFGEWLTFLVALLRREKRRKTIAPFIEALPFQQRCQSCGKRPASQRDPVTADWLCSWCQIKRERGRKQRTAFTENFAQWVKEEKGIGEIGARPEDLDQLAGPEGKIALLYADGNNMGDLLRWVSHPDDFQKVSSALINGTKDALFRGLFETFGPERLSESPLPFEIIAIGGDDLVVVTRASAGWLLALRVLQNFQNHPQIRQIIQILNLPGTVPLTMSAGLVIADVKYPVRFLFDLATGLLRKAKSLAKQQPEGTLCHLWLRDPVVSENPDDILQPLFHFQTEQIRYSLTARPYTVKEGFSLLEQAKVLASFPSSQRRLIAESLPRGILFSVNTTLYQAARMGERSRELTDALNQLSQILTQRGGARKGVEFWVFDPSGECQTALLDALELVELNAHSYGSEGLQ